MQDRLQMEVSAMTGDSRRHPQPVYCSLVGQIVANFLATSSAHM